ncbi:hypothetical protein P8C59_003604 [Phyllachora maydis]|uniref:RNase III domain-containing protein n=1 Tax=Phyllachora maydis TaxID=1825666 RepID=A0AAD9I1R5_9PEZI|nr:hypothetical protein P8C59_003604 [Phyllachora maydis]
MTKRKQRLRAVSRPAAGQAPRPTPTGQKAMASEDVYDFSALQNQSRSDFAGGVRACERAIGYAFRNKLLCYEALNSFAPALLPHPDHPSFCRVVPRNQVLAVLGDKLLYARLAVAWMRRGMVRHDPAALAKWQSISATYTTNFHLRNLAEKLGLGGLIFTVDGTCPRNGLDERTGGTVVEALIGAVYLDAGEGAVDVLLKSWGMFDLGEVAPVGKEEWDDAFLHNTWIQEKPVLPLEKTDEVDKTAKKGGKADKSPEKAGQVNKSPEKVGKVAKSPEKVDKVAKTPDEVELVQDPGQGKVQEDGAQTGPFLVRDEPVVKHRGLEKRVRRALLRAVQQEEEARVQISLIGTAVEESRSQQQPRPGRDENAQQGGRTPVSDPGQDGQRADEAELKHADEGKRATMIQRARSMLGL